MTDIPKLVRKYVTEEMRGMYTISTAIVETVDNENRLVEASLKADPEVILGDVPIAATHAEEGYGELVPIKEGTEGLIFHTKEPLTELVLDPGHKEMDPPPTEFRLRDGIFFPNYWNTNENTPAQDFDYNEGDYLYAHPSGSQIWIYGQNGSEKPGTVKIVAEGDVKIEADVVKLGNPLKHAVNEDAQINDTFLGLGGGVKDPGSTNG